MERQNLHLEKLAQRRPLTYVHYSGETREYPSTQVHGVGIDSGFRCQIWLQAT